MRRYVPSVKRSRAKSEKETEEKEGERSGESYVAEACSFQEGDDHKATRGSGTFFALVGSRNSRATRRILRRQAENKPTEVRTRERR